jgi:hypothetical protein
MSWDGGTLESLQGVDQYLIDKLQGGLEVNLSFLCQKQT